MGNNPGKPKPPRVVLRAEAAKAIIDWASGKLKKGSPEEADALRAVSWCLQEAATVFAEIDQWLAPAGYRPSVDPAIWRLLSDVSDPTRRDFSGVQLAIERIRHRGRPRKFDDRQIAEFVWHLVQRRCWKRAAAHSKACEVFNAKLSTVQKAISKWEPIYEWAEELMPKTGQARLRGMTRSYATTPPDDADEVVPRPDKKKPVS